MRADEEKMRKGNMGVISRCFFLKVFFLSAFVLLATAAGAIDLDFTWDSPTSAPVNGYRFYAGPGEVGKHCDEVAEQLMLVQDNIPANTTDTKLYDLEPGVYCFAVTAFIDDTVNNFESGFSNILKFPDDDSFDDSGDGSGNSFDNFSCDLVDDGILDTLDVRELVEVILDLKQDIDPVPAFDLNRDGSVNVLDLQYLNNVVLGLRSCYEIPS